MDRATLALFISGILAILILLALVVPGFDI
jgi:hypothetical protein